MKKNSTTKKKQPKKRKPETRGRPAMPPELRRVKLSTRVRPDVAAGFSSRAKAQGVDSRGVPRSSVALEIERAYDATQPAPPSSLT